MTLSLWGRLALEEAAAGRVRGVLAGRATLRRAFEDLGLDADPDMPAPEMVAQAQRALAVASEPNPAGATQDAPDGAEADREPSDAPGTNGDQSPGHSGEALILAALAEGPSSGRALVRRLGRRRGDVCRTLLALEAAGTVVRLRRKGAGARWCLQGGEHSRGEEHPGGAEVQPAPVGGARFLEGREEAEALPVLMRGLRRIAIHEAAHACVADVLGVPVLKVSILPDCSANRGEAHTFPIRWMQGGLRKRLRADLLLRLAGPVANMPALTSATTPDSDFPTSRRLLREHGPRLPRKRQPWSLGTLLREARVILGRPVVRAMVHDVAGALLERGTVGGAEVHTICRRARRRFRRAQRRAGGPRP